MVQLFHAGRMSHPAFQHRELPVGPSPITAGPATELYDGVHPFTRPRALQAAEFAGITAQFGAAAERALAAGFDGVECTAPTATCSTNSCAAAPTSATTIRRRIRNRARLLREVTAPVITIAVRAAAA